VFTRSLGETVKPNVLPLPCPTPALALPCSQYSLALPAKGHGKGRGWRLITLKKSYQIRGIEDEDGIKI
jgi:hypothetical protein